MWAQSPLPANDPDETLWLMAPKALADFRSRTFTAQDPKLEKYSPSNCGESVLSFLGIWSFWVYLEGTWHVVVVENNLSLKTSDESDLNSPTGDGQKLLQLGRPMLLAVSLSTSILDKLPKAWFIYLFIAVGVILFVISCFGCIGAVTRNGCCLTCYSLLVILLILVELGCAAFIFFDKSWKDALPTDKTGDFDLIYNFLKENWKIAKWVALGAVILEALVFLLAIIVRAANRPPDYDSDDEYLAPRSGVRQPLITRQGIPATGVPVGSNLDSRQNRNDAWSTRMREKYGLDTAEFTYNPNESNRYQQAAAQPVEERSRCTIMKSRKDNYNLVTHLNWLTGLSTITGRPHRYACCCQWSVLGELKLIDHITQIYATDDNSMNEWQSEKTLIQGEGAW
ncbi:hypothetical protein NE237_029118 [Protea cynaroides]|uniref:Tobamovirus multiplication protein 2A n=1 Tax=Protea cynaroides TaxID=273540 RepID=A0A9Q0GSJ1_9MAGN|nr:hypothetical protein NE237_029118 [Protea cynaroides]